MKLSLVFTFLLTTVCAAEAFAACGKARMPDAPAIPPGSDATVREMYEAQNHVKAFIKSAQKHLKCVVNPALHNERLDQVYSIAEAYNKEVRILKARYVEQASL